VSRKLAQDVAAAPRASLAGLFERHVSRNWRELTGSNSGGRCLRLVKDPRTGAVHRRTEADPPPPVGKRYASHAHGERRELAALAKETPDGT
jgi:hypothetical protein